MCGISGIFHHRSGQSVDPQILKKMTDALAHRGPDGEGIWCKDNIGLGHRRLAILDPSERGRQPMQGEDARFVISFNGEIYNFKELRKELEVKGHNFKTGTDTEVLLQGYAEWGEEIFSKLNGMFAFAIWDNEKKELCLARDPFGIKPLFYSDTPSGFRFASEIKSIISDPKVSREIDINALDSFFTYSYIPAPDTGLVAVKQLLPGHYAIVSENGFVQNRYYVYPTDAGQNNLSFDEALQQFGENFQSAVEAHMISDVPIGAFLSAGVDSAGVVLAMSRSGHGKVRAFTSSFKDELYDESKEAAKVAEKLGVEHIINDGSIDPQKIIGEVSKHLEEPFADSSSLAVYQICKAARSQVKVVLSGDGADELLGGYNTYFASQLARYYRIIPGVVRRRILRPALEALPFNFSKRNSQNLLKRFLYATELGKGTDHAAWRVIFREDFKDLTMEKVFRQKTKVPLPYLAYSKHTEGAADHFTNLLRADALFYLPNDMLVKMDRMSMAHGLEVRVPYLDKRLTDFCIKLPARYKCDKFGRRKIILRNYLQGHVPQEIITRPKTGFNVPLARWMRRDLSVTFKDLLGSGNKEISQFFNIREIEKMFDAHVNLVRDYCHELFALLMFFLWLKNLQEEWK